MLRVDPSQIPTDHGPVASYSSQSSASPHSPTLPQAPTMPRPAARTCACSHSGGFLLSPKSLVEAREKDHPYTFPTPTQMIVFMVTTTMWWVLYFLFRAIQDTAE